MNVNAKWLRHQYNMSYYPRVHSYNTQTWLTHMYCEKLYRTEQYMVFIST